MTPKHSVKTYNCLLQWAIYDAYITDQEKQRAQEEANKQKAAAKKANASAGTAETSQDPVKACLLSSCTCLNSSDTRMAGAEILQPSCPVHFPLVC